METQNEIEHSGHNLTLSQEQMGDLTRMLNITLRARDLHPEYASRLNDIFKQLTGHDHEFWGANMSSWS